MKPFPGVRRWPEDLCRHRGRCAFIAYLAPLVIKLKDVSLGVVILIALTMMLIDLVQSLKSKED